MKTIFKSGSKLVMALACLCLLSLASCEKETANLTSVTYYPLFKNTTGDGGFNLVANVGDDVSGILSGITAESDGELLETTSSGSVDTQTPGVYAVTYTATNADGFDGSQTLIINVVCSEFDDQDISGNYNGSGFGANTAVVTVTKTGVGTYSVNKTLASGNNVPSIFYYSGCGTITAPGNASPFGQVGYGPDFPGTAGSYNENTGVLSWIVYVSCCGNFGPITLVPA